MKNILIVGMSSVLGGVETYIYNLIKYIDKDGLSFDFLVVGEKSVFEDYFEKKTRYYHSYI